MSDKKYKLSAAFTVVEIAIALVIIGLIIIGIFAGKNLIDSSKRNNVIKDYNSYNSAVMSFNEKYRAIPGDMRTPVSQSYFGVPGGGGNRMVGYSGNEEFRAWQHLSLARMIKGTYTGTICSGTARNCGGTNVPESPYNAAVWIFFYLPPAWASGVFTLLHGHVFALGSQGLTWTDGALTPEDAMFIDLKFDDGNPQAGFIVNFEQAHDCTVFSGGIRVYNNSYESLECALLFDYVN